MKVALISPKGSFLSNNSDFKKFWKKNNEVVAHRRYWSGFGSGLLIIAALLPKNTDIKLIDENIDPIDYNENFDLVAVATPTTQQANRAYKIADNFKEKGIKVIIGGIHATVLPKEAKAHADSVIIGEVESVWADFMKDFLNNNIKPFYSSKEQFDLKKSPMPRYDLVAPENYKMVWVQASRGCPYDCEFCVASKIYGFKFRHKTISMVIEELKTIKRIWKDGVKIGFSDDNLFVDRKYADKLIKAMAHLNIRWFAQCDISVGAETEFLSLLRKSGCELLFIGIESANKNSLNEINKNRVKAHFFGKYKKYIKNIQSQGIGVMGAFVIGLDGDDLSIFDKTIDFIVANKIYASQITTLTPLPGTRLRDRLLEENRILSTSWDNYTFGDVNFLPKKMTPVQLQKGLVKIYQKIYSKEVRKKIGKHFKKIYLKMFNNKK
ncbi:MAG: radical SAM protein [Candidatus Omnitrophota bacterium]|jgi:radical SAM superfamily enzyme YgiQ (UPF0313 family)